MFYRNWLDGLVNKIKINHFRFEIIVCKYFLKNEIVFEKVVFLLKKYIVLSLSQK